MPERSTWTSLHARVHRTLRSRHLLKRKQRILVALSGGQDSLCLTKLLLDLQPKWYWQLGIAHCDHRWRSDSQANANYVQQLAKTWETPFYCQTAEQSLSSEAAARQWRYQALSAIAQANGYTCIVTGHTASDRAETLLYNLIRGSGSDGLQALSWKRALNSQLLLVRPLLEVTRAETAKFCQSMQLQVWEDATNQNLNYARNRIRQELIPYLHRFNPQVESTLAQTAELLQAEVEYLEQAASQLCQQATSLEKLGENFSPSPLAPQHQFLQQREPPPQAGSSSLKINRCVLQTAPLALQRRAIRQILQQILPYTPSFAHIEKLAALITAANGTQTDPFPGGAIAYVNKDWICLKHD
jgi:tRNA(Ile)-lysidine synthase